MRASSTSPTTPQQLDRIFRALGDETRRTLLGRLADHPAKITDLAAPFKMSLPAVSRHIRVLEAAGLVTRTIEGRIHECTLTAAPLHAADTWLRTYRRFWGDQLDALARYVEQDTPRARQLSSAHARRSRPTHSRKGSR